MKYRIALLIGAALLTACDAKAPTLVEPLSLEPSFSAVTNTTNEFIPVDIVVFVSCANGGAGEVVVLSGNLHVLSHVTQSNSGNFVTKVHFQPQGISGEGVTTGDKYQATGVTQQTAHGTGTFTFINNFRIIGQGPGNNFTVHQTVHVTVNANGEVTSVVNNTNIDCK